MKVMEMEFTVLGEISPAQKDKCTMFSVFSLGDNSMKGEKKIREGRLGIGRGCI